LKEELTGRSSKKKSAIPAVFVLRDVLLSLFRSIDGKTTAFGGSFIAEKLGELEARASLVFLLVRRHVLSIRMSGAMSLSLGKKNSKKLWS
jgi:hypothetical protein